MIDFHCHILPGLDDGAPDWAESLEMARFLSCCGVTGVVATPHHLEGYFVPSPDRILECVKVLQEKLDEENIGLKVYPGCEAHICPELPELVRRHQVLTINNGGRYLLVEFPFCGFPVYAEKVFFQLRLAGITPVIAHPERCQALTEDIDRLLELLRRGCLAQLNTGSFLGLYGRQVQRAAQDLLAEGAVHFLGSDMHGAGSRLMEVGDALTFLEAAAGVEKLEAIARENPALVLDGKTVDSGEYMEEHLSKGLWSRLKGRFLR